MAADAEEELAAAEAAAAAAQQQGEGAEGAGAGPGGGEGAAAPAAGEGGGAPRVTAEAAALLRETADRCGTRMREALDACCAEAVAVDAAARRVSVRGALRGGAVGVPELLGALAVLGLQEATLRAWTERLVSDALEPMLSRPCSVTVTAAPARGDPATLTWAPAPPGTPYPARTPIERRGSAGGGGAGGEAGVCDPAHCCQALLRLLATWLLEFDEGLMEVFGAPFWRAAADCYVARVAAPYIAANAEDLDGCDAVVAAAADLEAMAESLSFASGEDPHLAPAVEGLARHALSSRQEAHLARARQLLVGQQAQQAPGGPGDGGGGGDGKSGWETVAVGQPLVVDEAYYGRLAAGELQDWEAADPPCGVSTEGPLLAAGRYLVTGRMAAVAELVGGLLEEACAGGRAVSRALRSAVTSIALMARTLPAAAAASSSASPSGSPLAVPQLGLLAVTDLQHLAAVLLAAAPAYGGALDAAAGEAAGAAAGDLVAEALALRRAARRVLGEVLRHQFAALDDILAGLDGLRGVGLGDAKAGMRHRRAVQGLLHSLGRLGRVATETLAPADAVAVGGAVLDHAAGRLVGAITDKSDIGREECGELRSLLGPLAEGGVEAWLGGARAAGADLSGVPLDVVASALDARALQLRKLRASLALLGADSLAAIGRLWEGGELGALGAGEVEGLVLAVCEDSPGRRALLARLQ